MRRITFIAFATVTLASTSVAILQHFALRESREEAAMYQEILQPMIMCLAAGGMVAHDGASLRCMSGRRSLNLL